MLRTCRPQACEGILRHSSNGLDLGPPGQQGNAYPGVDPLPTMRAPSEGGAVTSDPFRTLSNLEDHPDVFAGIPKEEPKGGLLSSCASCNICKHVNGSGDLLVGGRPIRYPEVDEDDDAEGYMLLEDGPDEEKDAEAMVQEMDSMKASVKGLRKLLGMLVVLVFALSTSLGYYAYSGLEAGVQNKVRIWVLLASIPIVALLFTWFHIWLAIQMMFLPLRFIGIYQHKGSGMGIGWQGIVPRKAHKMAQTAYSSGRPYLDGPREWMTRVDASKLVAEFRPQLKDLVQDCLAQTISRHFPKTDSMLSANFRENLAISAVDKIQETSNELWTKWIELLADPVLGVDNDGMIVKVFTENKELLNQFFLKLGAREFRFIEHSGAAMGFLCGFVQLVAFNNLSPAGRAIFLPLSGFFLGIISNWAAIYATFHPCHPYKVRCCGVHICTIQGLFLKRKNEVAVLYSKLLCENFLNFPKVVNYLGTKPELWRQLKETYVAHNARVLKEVLGRGTQFAALALGQDEFNTVEKDLEKSLVKGLAKSTDIHRIGGRYIAKVTNIEKNNITALQHMSPEHFEMLLHPVFQEDEWILILLGGVLGAIVGIAQVCFLKT